MHSLPCGVTAQDDPTDESLSRTLPIPLDAILPEHDTESMQMFITLPVKVLRRQFPRLPEDRGESPIEDDEAKAVATNKRRNKEYAKKDSTTSISRTHSGSVHENGQDNDNEADPSSTRNTHSESSDENEDGEIEARGSRISRSRSFDKVELAEKLLNVCDPSASLFRLHRYVLDELKIEVSSSELLELFRSSSEFQIRTVHHAFPTDTFRVRNPSLPGADDVHYRKDDPRLASCTCRPGSSRSQIPCESWACVIPHAVIVSSTSTELHLDDTAPTSAATQEMPIDLADIIVAAQAVYDDMYESE